MNKESGVVLKSAVSKMCLDSTICIRLESNAATVCAGKTAHKDLSSIYSLELPNGEDF